MAGDSGVISGNRVQLGQKRITEATLLSSIAAYLLDWGWVWLLRMLRLAVLPGPVGGWGQTLCETSQSVLTCLRLSRLWQLPAAQLQFYQ
jgi:hypothetical protein